MQWLFDLWPRLLVLLVGALLGGFAGGFFGYEHGLDVAQLRALANHAAAQDAAIASARDDAVTDMQAAKEWGESEAQARAQAREAGLRAHIDALRKSRPDCSRDAESLGLLDDAINRANAATDAAPGVSGAVPADP